MKLVSRMSGFACADALAFLLAFLPGVAGEGRPQLDPASPD